MGEGELTFILFVIKSAYNRVCKSRFTGVTAEAGYPADIKAAKGVDVIFGY